MSKIKLSFSFLLSLLLVGLFSAVAFAAGSTTPDPVNGGNALGTNIQSGLVQDDRGNDNAYNTLDKSNANKTGSGVGGQTQNFNQVIKSSGLHVNPQDSTSNVQRTHGEYMNNTNSCASCHQTHTGAASSLLFKDGKYQTCTACHDGTLGFYNVFASGDQASNQDFTTGYTGNGFDNSAGTFGGNTAGNMSVHLANGTVQLAAAPGGNRNATTGSWTDEFSCASCHAPHGSFSDRLLNENPNDMANTPIDNGGQKVVGVPVIDKNTTGFDFTFKTKWAAADHAYTIASGATSYNYIIYRFQIGDANAPTGNTYVANDGTTALNTGDWVFQVMKWNGTNYVVDKAPWMHGYVFDSSHKKHDWSFLYINGQNYTSGDFSGQPIEKIDTDFLQKGEILGAGYAAFPSTVDSTTLGLITTVTNGNVARAYVVKLDVSPSPDSTLASENVKVTNVSALWMNGNGRGVQMSTFCAACHTDYLASSSEGNENAAPTGTFDTAYRHTTISDTYTCVRCHYPHGTDVTVMRDARGLTYQQILNDTTDYFPTLTSPTDPNRISAVQNYLLDKNPSSALKRYTNMAVCWACHTSSHSEGTRNTSSYQYNPTPGINTDRNGIGNSVGGGTVNAGY